MIKRVLLFLCVIVAGGGIFLAFSSTNRVDLTQISDLAVGQLVNSSPNIVEEKPDPNRDEPAQKPLENPPAVIKAIYSTGWSAGTAKKVDYFINLIKDTELNAIVIDIKDYSGYVDYDSDIELINKYKAEEIKILKINSLIKKFHDVGIYVIARIAVFQDPILAKERPDIALQSKASGATWKDNKGLAWVDPSSRDAWDYNIAIAKDVAARGFDEINFDYIRFASDGNMNDIVYPVWDKKTSKAKVIGSFAKYLRESLPGIKISADLFGLTTVNYDDLGIGQKLEEIFPYFDYVAPMVYPSHYASGFNGFKNPSLYPYEVVQVSMGEAQKRLNIFANASTTIAAGFNIPEFRPWLQDFDLGADYDASKVRAQINATVNTSASTTPAGWMLWNPSNVYTKDALMAE